MYFHKALAAALSALTACCCVFADSGDTQNQVLETVVVTAVAMEQPLRLETDPHKPRQPLPAHDGADYLKTIPGFSVIRKGGADGDPVFRGMAASRVNILLDGASLAGGCGMRMDPPTAYIYPEAYDRIVVIKGPQTVLHGSGNSAATVLFERDPQRLTETGWTLGGSTTAASFGRNDEVLNLRGGNRHAYAEFTGTHSRADDYEDGDGKRVHSRYRRWNTSSALGWTPDDHTLVELSLAHSDGEAAYADRAMDGAEFSRRNRGLHFTRDNVSTLVRNIDARLFYNHIDHVMDNYSLRTFAPSMMMAHPAASNPDRLTRGGRATIELALTENALATLGIDHQRDRHRLRATMNQTLMPFQSLTRNGDAEFSSSGVFGELEYRIDDARRLIGGLRTDHWQAEDQRETLRLGMMTVTNPGADENREEWLPAAFSRYEQDLANMPVTVYAGIGHVERFPDYWEALADKESVASTSAFGTRSENTTQLDVGIIYSSAALSLSASLFANRIDDYILVESSFRKGMRDTTVTRNIDARSAGGELGVAYLLSPNWKADASLAYTRGDNRTDGGALAQLPPLEARLGLNYDDRRRSLGLLLRLVDDQHRYAINQGNVAGQDLGASSGFAVLSLNGGWRFNDSLELSAGIDNLFDRRYAEHISRGGAMLAGYTQTERVNEAGRTAWLRLGFHFD